MMPQETQTLKHASPRWRWLRRFAKASFWFFLIKGLLWLLLPVAAVYFGLEA